MIESVYPCGETITKKKIQDEPWYSDYQAAAEVLQQDIPNFFYEEQKDGLNLALSYVKDYINKDYDDERLLRWIKSLWLSEQAIKKIRYMDIAEKIITKYGENWRALIEQTTNWLMTKEKILSNKNFENFLLKIINESQKTTEKNIAPETIVG